MEKQFIPYELALELKELGFDEKCIGLWQSKYNSVPYLNINSVENIDTLLSGKIHNEDVNYIVKSPLWQQVFDWFRYVMLLDNFITPYWFIDGEYKVKKYIYSIEPSNRFDEYFDCDSDQYDTYEEARLECLKKLINIIK